MSVLFLGAYRIGIECLSELLRKKIPVKYVVVRKSDTGEDRPGFPSLRKFALSKKLEVLAPEKINDPGLGVRLAEARPDWMISVQYDQILREPLLKLPRHAVNLHFAPLPKCRGCFPIAWAMIEGHDAGVSLHELDAGIDTGNLIAVRKIPVRSKDTGETIYRRAEREGIRLFRETLMPMIRQGRLMSFPQDNAAASYHPAGYPFDRVIDWQWPVEKVDRFVRALTFPPFPSARTAYLRREIEVLSPVKINPSPGKTRTMGEVLQLGDRSWKIQAGNGAVELFHFKLDGKKKTAGQAWNELGLREGHVLGKAICDV